MKMPEVRTQAQIKNAHVIASTLSRAAFHLSWFAESEEEKEMSARLEEWSYEMFKVAHEAYPAPGS